LGRSCKTSHHQFDIARFKGGEDEQIGIWLNAGTRIRTALIFVGAFLFTGVDWLEPNRRLAIILRCAIVAAAAK
jgi:hypothetical protein